MRYVILFSLVLALSLPHKRKAWNDLYHMGYRSDLTAGHGYGDDSAYIKPNKNDPSQWPPLPLLTTKALTRYV